MSSFGCTPRGMTPAFGASGCEWMSRCASAWRRSSASSGGSSRTGPGSWSWPLGRPGGGDGPGWRCPRRWRSETFPAFVPGVGDRPKRGREGGREGERRRETAFPICHRGRENKTVVVLVNQSKVAVCRIRVWFGLPCWRLLRRWRFGGRDIHPTSWSPFSVEVFHDRNACRVASCVVLQTW